MIIDGHNSKRSAVGLILFGLIMLIVGYFIILDKQEPTSGYWVGVIVASVLLLIILGKSYTIGKRKLTAREKRNMLRTASSARLGWMWAGIGFVLYLVSRYVFKWDWATQPMPALIGGFGAACLLIGIAILFDNFWLRAIFAWNSSDPSIRKIFGGK